MTAITASQFAKTLDSHCYYVRWRLSNCGPPPAFMIMSVRSRLAAKWSYYPVANTQYSWICKTATSSEELSCCSARHGTVTTGSNKAKQPHVSRGVRTNNVGSRPSETIRIIIGTLNHLMDPRKLANVNLYQSLCFGLGDIRSLPLKARSRIQQTALTAMYIYRG